MAVIYYYNYINEGELTILGRAGTLEIATTIAIILPILNSGRNDCSEMF